MPKHKTRNTFLAMKLCHITNKKSLLKNSTKAVT